MGKVNDELCEDGLVMTPGYIAVIDGSTSKTSFRHFSEVTNGKMAMQLVQKYIRREAKNAMSVDEFCQGLTQYFSRMYRAAGTFAWVQKCPQDRLTASVAVYSAERNEVWLIGDCQAIVDGTYYENAKPFELSIAQKRASLIKDGHSPSEARYLIEPELVRTMLNGQNKAYAVIDGFKVYMEGVKVIPVRHSVVLATDGYPFLKSTLSDSEDALAEQLENDPQNINSFYATKGLIKGNKSFDDRAYIRFAVGRISDGD